MKNLLLLLSLFCLGGSFLSLAAQSPDDAARGQLLFDTGNDLISKGDFKAAIQKFTEAAEVLPNWHLPYLNRGVANLSLMNLAQAEADADKALSLIRPGMTGAKLHSATALQVKGTIKQHQGDYKAALEQFTGAIEQVPDNPKFLNSRGTIYRLLKEYEASLADYSKAIGLDPKMAMFHMNRATINEVLGNSDAALKDVDEAIRLDKNMGAARYTRGSLRLKKKAFAEALADFDEAIRLEPNKSAYFHARGIVHIHMKNYDLGIKDQTEAIALDPRNVFAYSDRSIAQGYAGNTKAAIEDMRSAIALNGTSAALRFNLGYFLFRSGQYTEAAEAATRAIERAPTWRDAYLLRSNAHVKLGVPAKAKADREKAATLARNGRPTNDPHMIFNVEVFMPEETKP